MGEHLKQGAPETVCVQSGETQQNKSHMAHARVSDHFLEIGLGKRHESAVHDPDQGENRHGRPEPHGRLREKGIAETEKAVSPHLEQDSCQDDADGGRGFHMRVRKPGVERENRDLDREAQKKCHKSDLLEQESARHSHKPGQVEGVRRGREINGQDAQKHEEASGEGKEEKLDRGIFAPGPAPDSDQKIHRNEHDFPNHIKKEKVEGQKACQHAGLEQQKQKVIFLPALLDAERTQACERANKSREKHHGKTDPVRAEQVLDVELGDPRGLLHHLKAAMSRLKEGQGVEDEPENRQRGRESDPRDGRGEALRHEQYRQAAEQRRKNNPG